MSLIQKEPPQNTTTTYTAIVHLQEYKHKSHLLSVFRRFTGSGSILLLGCGQELLDDTAHSHFPGATGNIR